MRMWCSGSSKEDFQKPEMRREPKEALVQYVKGFEQTQFEAHRGLYPYGRSKPHLHLDYIPVAQGYTRGLETRNSLDKAMKQMGYQPEKREPKEQCHEALERE